MNIDTKIQIIDIKTNRHEAMATTDYGEYFAAEVTISYKSSNEQKEKKLDIYARSLIIREILIHEKTSTALRELRLSIEAAPKEKNK